MEELMARMGHPERRFRAVHVAGTNGKGSVSALLESIARSSGLRTALYTSPHLSDLTERIRHQGRAVSRREFGELIGSVLQQAGSLEPRLTHFEIVTAAAFLHFARRRTDLAVIEVGLGGRLDATNVLPRPELSVITNIGLDHQAYLGNTLARIAREKAGIIKADGAAVTGASGAALEVIRRTAKKRNCRLTSVHGRSVRLPGLTLDGASRDCALKGEFQRENLRMVLAAVSVLRDQGWTLPLPAVRRGLREVRWPGRFDWRDLRLKGRSVPVLIDGAHNPAAMTRLLEALRRTRLYSRPAALVFNALKDKNVSEMALLLRRALKIEEVFIPALPTERSMDPKQTQKLFPGPSRTAPSVRSAWSSAKKTRAEWVLATGSLYLVGETLKALPRIVPLRRIQ
jgi:dihydrofolate synthase/folylpolyglutamate synthase